MQLRITFILILFAFIAKSQTTESVDTIGVHINYTGNVTTLDNQQLTLYNDTLYIERGNFIDLTPYLIDDDNQTINYFSVDTINNLLYIAIDGADTLYVDLTSLNLPGLVPQTLSLVENILTLSGVNTPINLSGYIDSDTDDQNLNNTRVGNTVTLNITDGTGTSFSVADGDTSSTNEIYIDTELRDSIASINTRINQNISAILQRIIVPGGCMAGQVLKWDAAEGIFKCMTDAVVGEPDGALNAVSLQGRTMEFQGTYAAEIPSIVFSNWDTLHSDDVLQTTQFGGDVTGTYDDIVIANNSHTHDTSSIVPNIVSSINGVINDGGNINLIGGNNISITPNNTTKQIEIAATVIANLNRTEASPGTYGLYATELTNSSGTGVYLQGDTILTPVRFTNGATRVIKAGVLEEDPTVPISVKLITQNDIDRWNLYDSEGEIDAAVGNNNYTGPVGPQGPMGEGIQIVGTVANAASLPSPGGYGGNIGDIYITNDDGHGYAFTGAAWNDIGELRGPIGLTGAQGNPGTPGAAGTAATLDLGTVSTGSAGTNVTITNTGTSNAAIFNFTIPRGNTGLTGAQGVRGSKIFVQNDQPGGIANDYWVNLSGDVKLFEGGDWVSKFSIIGPQGPQGLQGSVGQTGGVGPQGDTGVRGTQIFAQPTTPTGSFLSGDIYIDTDATNIPYYQYNGSNWNTLLGYLKGPQGDTGAPGTNGTNGTNGLPGTNGTNGTNGVRGTQIFTQPTTPTGSFLSGDIYIDTDAANIPYYQYNGSNWNTLLGYLKGPQGDTGAPGTNGTNGTNGLPGTNGTNGTDGVGISSVVPNPNGTVTINLTNATSVTTGSLIGPAGANGTPGAKGDTGDAGANGLDGTGISSTVYNPTNGQLTINFTSGAPYVTGDLRGSDGSDGTNGLPGAPGTNGTNGVRGTQIFAQPTTPTGSFLSGDIYIDTDATNIPYYQYNGSNWNTQLGTLKGASGTNGTNGTPGSQIYAQTTAPLTANVGDIFIDTDDDLIRYYRFNGSIWNTPIGWLKGPSGNDGAPGQNGAPGVNSWGAIPDIPTPFADGIDNVDDADNVVGNEFQDLTLGTRTGTVQSIGIVNGSGINIDVADNDNSTINEWQDLDEVLEEGSIASVNRAISMTSATGAMELTSQNDMTIRSINGALNLYTWPGSGGILSFGTDDENITFNTGLTSMTLRPSTGSLDLEADLKIFTGTLTLLSGASTLQDLTVNGTFSNPSDIRIKKDIQDIGYGLDEILRLAPIKYKYKKGGDRTRLGLIAQDLEIVMPELVITGQDGMKSVAYTELIAPLIRAIQEQQVQINQLKKELEKLKE